MINHDSICFYKYSNNSSNLVKSAKKNRIIYIIKELLLIIN